MSSVKVHTHSQAALWSAKFLSVMSSEWSCHGTHCVELLSLRHQIIYSIPMTGWNRMLCLSCLSVTGLTSELAIARAVLLSETFQCTDIPQSHSQVQWLWIGHSAHRTHNILQRVKETPLNLDRDLQPRHPTARPSSGMTPRGSTVWPLSGSLSLSFQPRSHWG